MTSADVMAREAEVRLARAARLDEQAVEAAALGLDPLPFREAARHRRDEADVLAEAAENARRASAAA